LGARLSLFLFPSTDSAPLNALAKGPGDGARGSNAFALSALLNFFINFTLEKFTFNQHCGTLLKRATAQPPRRALRGSGVIVAATDGSWRTVMQRLKEKGLVDLVYPEFFDDCRSLLARRPGRYLARLRALCVRGEVRVAVWPDYCYNARIRDAFAVDWVFPLHRKAELEFALRVADFVGFPNRPALRDYDLRWFAEAKREQGFLAWLLGFKPRFMRHVGAFDGCDVSPLGLGVRYARAAEIDARLLEAS